MEPRSERTVLHRSRGRCRPGARRLTRREKASATPRTPPRSPPGQRGSAALRHVRPSTPTAAHGGRSRPSGTYLPPACVEAMLAAYGPDGARRRLGCVPHARGRAPHVLVGPTAAEGGRRADAGANQDGGNASGRRAVRVSPQRHGQVKPYWLRRDETSDVALVIADVPEAMNDAACLTPSASLALTAIWNRFAPCRSDVAAVLRSATRPEAGAHAGKASNCAWAFWARSFTAAASSVARATSKFWAASARAPR